MGGRITPSIGNPSLNSLLKMNKYYFLRNLQSKDAHSVQCRSDLEQYVAEVSHTEKEKFREWCNSQHTNHVFFSMIEGQVDVQRVVTDDSKPDFNPPHRIHGIVGDYDYPWDDAKIDEFVKNSKHPPTMISKSFSGNVHAVWEFAEPIQVNGNPRVGAIFLRMMIEYLECEKLYPGFEKEATNLHKYFEYGHHWVDFKENIVPKSDLDLVFWEAAKKARSWSGKVEIPFDSAREEVVRQFGDNLRLDSGKFEVGKRSNAFWIMDSTNPTSCIICEDGIFSFSQENRFWPYREILGENWYKKHQTDAIENCCKPYFRHGDKYYEIDTSSRVHKCTKEMIANRLKVHKVAKEDAPDYFEYIHEEKRVCKVAPILYGERPVALVNGETVLNTSTIKPIVPCKGDCDEFQKYIYNLFKGSDPLAYEYFLAWLRDACRNVQKMIEGMDGSRGLVLFIAGPKGTGKSLLIELLSDLFGGHADAEDYIYGRSPYCGNELSNYLWVIDDPIQTDASHKEKQEFTNKLKRQAARSHHRYNEKYMPSTTVKWTGRIVIALNDDGTSSGALPTLRAESEDKFLILKTTDEELNAGPELGEKLRKQLPAFMHWLLEIWTPSEDMLPNLGGRFGVRSHVSKILRDQIEAQDPGNVFLELVDGALERGGIFSKCWSEGCIVEGKASDYNEDMGNLIQTHMSKMSTNSLGKLLKGLASRRRDRVEVRVLKGSNYFRIKPASREEDPF